MFPTAKLTPSWFVQLTSCSRCSSASRSWGCRRVLPLSAPSSNVLLGGWILGIELRILYVLRPYSATDIRFRLSDSLNFIFYWLFVCVCVCIHLCLPEHVLPVRSTHVMVTGQPFENWGGSFPVTLFWRRVLHFGLSWPRSFGLNFLSLRPVSIRVLGYQMDATASWLLCGSRGSNTAIRFAWQIPWAFSLVVYLF